MIEKITYYDTMALDFIQNHVRCALLDFLMPLITMLGDNGYVWILAAVIFLMIKKYRASGISVLFALLLCLLAGNMWLKPLIARVRPYDINTAFTLLIPRLADFSFPSSHTMSSFAAATAIYRGSRRIGVFALVLAFIIAFSRLYLYVHYPSDVLGGAVIGVVIGYISSFVCAAAVKSIKNKIN